MDNPATVFRANLHRLATVYDLNFDGLAAALGFGREDKKWLARAWTHGLSRPDSRSERRLKRVAKLFGLNDPSHMWVPDVEPSPERMAKTRTMRGENRWLDLVSRVADAMRIQDRLWQSHPDEMARIWSKYGDTNTMIASWVADKYGSHRVSEEERELIAGVEKEFAHALRLENTTGPLRRLSHRVQQHPAFDDLVKKMAQNLDLYIDKADLPISLYDDDDSDKPAIDGDRLQQHLLNRLRECMSRPLSEDEVYERFLRRYLCPKDDDLDDTEAEMLRSVMSELTAHPEWQRHVKRAFDNDHSAAEAAVSERWREARTKSGHVVSVDQFVHFFRSNILDELNQDHETEPGDIGSQRA